MAEKKKAYRRFEELTKKAIAPMASEAEQDPGSVNRQAGGGGTGMGSPAEAFTIWLSPELRRALEQQAAADNTTPSEIVQAALRRFLFP